MSSDPKRSGRRLWLLMLGGVAAALVAVLALIVSDFAHREPRSVSPSRSETPAVAERREHQGSARREQGLDATQQHPRPSSGAAGVVPTSSQILGAPSPTQIAELVREAQQAYVSGDFAKCRKHAQQVLDVEPDNVSALQIAASASCYLKDKIWAQIYLDRIPGLKVAAKRSVGTICARRGVQLVGLPP